MEVSQNLLRPQVTANDPPSPSALLVSTRRPSESPEPQQPELQHTAVAVTISLGGTDLVVGEA